MTRAQIIKWLREQYQHGAGSVKDCALCAAADDIETLEEALRGIVKRSPFVATETGVRAEITFAQIQKAQRALAREE